MANATSAAATAPNLEPMARASAPLAGAVRGDDELVPGAVDDGDPVPEAEGTVALPVGYGATGPTVGTLATVDGLATGTDVAATVEELDVTGADEGVVEAEAEVAGDEPPEA